MSKNNKNIAKKENLKNTQKRADIRKRLDREKRRKRDKIFLISMIAVALLVVGLYLTTTTFSGSSNNNSNSDDIQPEPAVDSPKSTGENDIRIKISDVNDGQAHFYSYDSNGVDIRYFVLESNDGKIRAAFDTCDTCYPAKKGYHQEGEQMVCNNCGLKFDSNNINEVKGGCNPAPLGRQVDGDELVINIDDIENGRWYFE